MKIRENITRTISMLIYRNVWRWCRFMIIAWNWAPQLKISVDISNVRRCHSLRERSKLHISRDHQNRVHLRIRHRAFIQGPTHRSGRSCGRWRGEIFMTTEDAAMRSLQFVNIKKSLLLLCLSQINDTDEWQFYESVRFNVPRYKRKELVLVPRRFVICRKVEPCKPHSTYRNSDQSSLIHFMPRDLRFLIFLLLMRRFVPILLVTQWNIRIVNKFNTHHKNDVLRSEQTRIFSVLRYDTPLHLLLWEDENTRNRKVSHLPAWQVYVVCEGEG